MNNNPHSPILSANVCRALNYGLISALWMDAPMTEPKHVEYGLLRNGLERAWKSNPNLPLYGAILDLERRILSKDKTSSGNDGIIPTSLFLGDAPNFPLFSTHVCTAILDSIANATAHRLGSVDVAMFTDTVATYFKSTGQSLDFSEPRIEHKLRKEVITILDRSFSHLLTNPSCIPSAGCFDSTSIDTLAAAARLTHDDGAKDITAWHIADACSVNSQFSTTWGELRNSTHPSIVQTRGPKLRYRIGAHWYDQSAFVGFCWAIDLGSLIAHPSVDRNWLFLAMIEQLSYQLDTNFRSRTLTSQSLVDKCRAKLLKITIEQAKRLPSLGSRSCTIRSSAELDLMISGFPTRHSLRPVMESLRQEFVNHLGLKPNRMP